MNLVTLNNMQLILTQFRVELTESVKDAVIGAIYAKQNDSLKINETYSIGNVGPTHTTHCISQDGTFLFVAGALTTLCLVSIVALTHLARKNTLEIEKTVYKNIEIEVDESDKLNTV